MSTESFARVSLLYTLRIVEYKVQLNEAVCHSAKTPHCQNTRPLMFDSVVQQYVIKKEFVVQRPNFCNFYSQKVKPP